MSAEQDVVKAVTRLAVATALNTVTLILLGVALILIGVNR